MKPSPVQLVHLTFRKVMVEVDDEVPFDSDKLRPFDAFNFEGVTFKTKIGVEELTEEATKSTSGHVFQLAFDLLVDNESVTDAETRVLSPYRIDVRAAALVRIPPGAERVGPPRDLAAVNGAAMIWSAFREQLSSLTSRMPRGPVMLPTVHFHDLKTGAAAKPAATPADTQLAAPVKRRLVRKAG